MADRKAELEKKRKKLEELKKAREQKKIEAKDKVLIPVYTRTCINTFDTHYRSFLRSRIHPRAHQSARISASWWIGS